MILLLTLVIIYALAWLPMNAYHILSVFDIIEFSNFKYCESHII